MCSPMTRTDAPGGLRSWEDIELIYAGQRIANDHPLRDYHIPPVRSLRELCERGASL
jgi:hypothetical protein